jgi:hypothetical protein
MAARRLRALPIWQIEAGSTTHCNPRTGLLRLIRNLCAIASRFFARSMKCGYYLDFVIFIALPQKASGGRHPGFITTERDGY